MLNQILKSKEKVFPLTQLSIAEAKEVQFQLVDLLHRHLGGAGLFNAGDYGAPPEIGRSRMTAKVEEMLAEFFGAEEVILVRSAGTGAIRCSLIANLHPGARVVIHKAPLYPTTQVTFRAMGIQALPIDFNTCDRLAETITEGVDCVYIQHSRQLLSDYYDLSSLISKIRKLDQEVLILIDDNYTVFRVPQIGCQMGADLSMFSMFKILGEIGVGCVVGRKKFVNLIRKDNYSGGSKVHGPEAIATYKSILYAPVAQAIEAEVANEVVRRISEGEVKGVVSVSRGNHQECNVLVELESDLDAPEVLKAAVRHGAGPYPVGAASRHEPGTLFYRLSGVMRQAEPELAQHFIRINPFRAGPDTIIRILNAAIEEVYSGSE